MAKNSVAAGRPGDSQMPEALSLHPSLPCFPVSLSQRTLLRLRAAILRHLCGAGSRALLLLLPWVPRNARSALLSRNYCCHHGRDQGGDLS